MPGQIQTDVQQVVGHISANCTDINYYKLIGNTGATTIKGIFLTRQGRQTGVAVSTTINAAGGAPVSLATTIPAGAVGFIGNLAGSVKMALYDAVDDTALASDFQTNYANYPTIAAGDAIQFGSVAVV